MSVTVVILTLNEARHIERAHLCAGTHEWRQTDMPLLKTPITIGKDCWIAADAFIGPNVTIGDHSIVGARGRHARHRSERYYRRQSSTGSFEEKFSKL